MRKPPKRENYWLNFSHLLPKKWTRIGNPIPVPGGFVFIVSMPVQGRLMYPITKWDANATGAAVFAPVLDDMGRSIVLADSTTARRVLAEQAHRLETEAD